MAARLLGIRQIVPMHYGTFPVLTGTPEQLKKLVDPHGVDVLVLKPGETAQ
jgi:L-ascorbate metabolism protein UlaG (beta-lactamase superfamily)